MNELKYYTKEIQFKLLCCEVRQEQMVMKSESALKMTHFAAVDY